MDYETLSLAVKPYLSEKRYAHTLRTCDMALKLAEKWGCDAQSTMETALLHDITKNLSEQEQLNLCEKYGIMFNYSGEDFSNLIHADTSAELARDLFGVTDGVYNAIKHHTLGKANMSLLEKIIYLADKIEEGRVYDGVSEMRQMAFQNLDKALLMSMEGAISFKAQKGGNVNEQTIIAANYIKESIKKTEVSQ